MKISVSPLCTFCGLESETQPRAPLRGLRICEIILGTFTAWVNSLGAVLNQPTDQEIMLGITGNSD